MPPCVSISELLSQIAINSPGQTRVDPPHPPHNAPDPPTHSPAAERDGGYAVATMQHSVAVPASLNLSVRDHINSTCHALLRG